MSRGTRAAVSAWLITAVSTSIHAALGTVRHDAAAVGGVRPERSGLTDDPADIQKTAAFAAGLGNMERVDVLPFRQMGRFKWKQLGLRYSSARSSRRRQTWSSRRWRSIEPESLTAY
jgi:hypothetical protein